MELQLPPDIEMSLRQQAAAMGMNTEQFAIVALQQGLSNAGESSTNESLPHDKWKEIFEELLAKFPKRNSDSSVDCSRDSIYGDNGR